MRIGRAAGAAVIVAAVLALAGCGGDSKMAEVSGTVKVDGAAADNGYVTFSPADGTGQPAGCEIKSDGSYSLKAPIGNMKVAIRVSGGTGQTKAAFPGAESPKQEIKEEILPEKCNDKTELIFDVKPGRNLKDWDLKSKKAEAKAK
jgi:hypothetical protein